MSQKNGYGNLVATLVSLEILGVLQESNRNAIIQLPSKNDKRIFTITAGYRLPTGTSATALQSGRLIVVGTKYEGDTEFIDPTIQQLPDTISSAQVFYDIPIIGGTGDALNRNAPPTHLDFTTGILIPAGSDASIILTFCTTSGGASFPASDPVTAFLNVHGYVGGSDKLFVDKKY